jgi:hypothetical protein
VGTLMIKCPNTGRTISTGITTDAPSFGSTPVFFSRTFCPICRINHDWFAKDAWVSDRSPGRSAPAHSMMVGASVLAVWAMRTQGRSRGPR